MSASSEGGAASSTSGPSTSKAKPKVTFADTDMRPPNTAMQDTMNNDNTINLARWIVHYHNCRPPCSADSCMSVRKTFAHKKSCRKTKCDYQGVMCYLVGSILNHWKGCSQGAACDMCSVAPSPFPKSRSAVKATKPSASQKQVMQEVAKSQAEEEEKEKKTKKQQTACPGMNPEIWKSFSLPQQRFALIEHACRCVLLEGSCHFEQCKFMLRTLNHCQNCVSDFRCPVEYCATTKFLIGHSTRCGRSPDCEFCIDLNKKLTEFDQEFRFMHAPPQLAEFKLTRDDKRFLERSKSESFPGASFVDSLDLYLGNDPVDAREEAVIKIVGWTMDGSVLLHGKQVQHAHDCREETDCGYKNCAENKKLLFKHMDHDDKIVDMFTCKDGKECNYSQCAITQQYYLDKREKAEKDGREKKGKISEFMAAAARANAAKEARAAGLAPSGSKAVQPDLVPITPHIMAMFRLEDRNKLLEEWRLIRRLPDDTAMKLSEDTPGIDLDAIYCIQRVSGAGPRTRMVLFHSTKVASAMLPSEGQQAEAKKAGNGAKVSFLTAKRACVGGVTKEEALAQPAPAPQAPPSPAPIEPVATTQLNKATVRREKLRAAKLLVQEHNNAKTPSTAGSKPYSEAVEAAQAAKREARVAELKRKQEEMAKFAEHLGIPKCLLKNDRGKCKSKMSAAQLFELKKEMATAETTRAAALRPAPKPETKKTAAAEKKAYSAEEALEHVHEMAAKMNWTPEERAQVQLAPLGSFTEPGPSTAPEPPVKPSTSTKTTSSTQTCAAPPKCSGASQAASAPEHKSAPPNVSENLPFGGSKAFVDALFAEKQAKARETFKRIGMPKPPAHYVTPAEHQLHEQMVIESETMAQMRAYSAASEAAGRLLPLDAPIPPQFQPAPSVRPPYAISHGPFFNHAPPLPSNKQSTSTGCISPGPSTSAGPSTSTSSDASSKPFDMAAAYNIAAKKSRADAAAGAGGFIAEGAPPDWEDMTDETRRLATEAIEKLRAGRPQVSEPIEAVFPWCSPEEMERMRAEYGDMIHNDRGVISGSKAPAEPLVGNTAAPSTSSVHPSYSMLMPAMNPMSGLDFSMSSFPQAIPTTASLPTAADPFVIPLVSSLGYQGIPSTAAPSLSTHPYGNFTRGLLTQQQYAAEMELARIMLGIGEPPKPKSTAEAAAELLAMRAEGEKHMRELEKFKVERKRKEEEELRRVEEEVVKMGLPKDALLTREQQDLVLVRVKNKFRLEDAETWSPELTWAYEATGVGSRIRFAKTSHARLKKCNEVWQLLGMGYPQKLEEAFPWQRPPELRAIRMKIGGNLYSLTEAEKQACAARRGSANPAAQAERVIPTPPTDLLLAQHAATLLAQSHLPANDPSVGVLRQQSEQLEQAIAAFQSLVTPSALAAEEARLKQDPHDRAFDTPGVLANMIIHATNCISNDCPYPNCRPTKQLLLHVKRGCDPRECTYHRCLQVKDLLMHWVTCDRPKGSCPNCWIIRDATPSTIEGLIRVCDQLVHSCGMFSLSASLMDLVVPEAQLAAIIEEQKQLREATDALFDEVDAKVESFKNEKAMRMPSKPSSSDDAPSTSGPSTSVAVPLSEPPNNQPTEPVEIATRAVANALGVRNNIPGLPNKSMSTEELGEHAMNMLTALFAGARSPNPTVAAEARIAATTTFAKLMSMASEAENEEAFVQAADTFCPTPSN